MTAQTFSLIPFPDSNISAIQITGDVAREASLFTIRYSLTDKTQSILFPERSASPGRKDELWTATCFEFFVALPEQPGYWECNLSPSGDWNIFYMDAYRRVGFREETFIQELPFSIRHEPSCISVEAALDLSPLVPVDQSIQVGITSVVKTINGHETYWALSHPAPQADFHLRESFLVWLSS